MTPTFAERYRPRVHFTPRAHWMNDPNGLVFHAGRYHLFHQHHPGSLVWGPMHWGHAVSRDLVHWEHRPVALAPDGDEMVFSGSAVVDAANTSGFGDGTRPPLVAVYTSHYDRSAEAGGPSEAQSLAYSLDDGERWTRHAGNPVLTRPERDFRDPGVFWHAPSGRWVMAVALPAARQILFYGSPNLRDWTPLSAFGPAGATGGDWECPDLFELPSPGGDPAETRWVLVVSLNPGGPHGGSAVQYFVGAFDGATFTADGAPSDPPRWVDHGPDFYAPQTWRGLPDGRRVGIGWMSDWRYARQEPTAPWRTAMAFPRALALRTGPDGAPALCQWPVAEGERLRGVPATVSRLPLRPGPTPLGERGVSGWPLDLTATFRAGRADRFGLRLRVGPGEATEVGYDVRVGEVYVDRTRAGEAGFHPAFAGRFAAPLALRDGRLRLRVVVDAASVEVFADDGGTVLTALVFPDPASRGVEAFAEGGAATLDALTAWPLASIWTDPG